MGWKIIMNIDFKNKVINEPFVKSDSFFKKLLLALIKTRPDIDMYTFKKGSENIIIKNYSTNFLHADYEVMISYYFGSCEYVVYIILVGKDIYKLWYTGQTNIKHVEWIGDVNAYDC